MQLIIDSLSKTYPNGVRALKNITLNLKDGMFGLLGPNGAGKSTLMRTIATLQDADQGSIVLDGLDVVREKTALRRLLGYLPQEFGVYPRITAEEMLDHIARLKGVGDPSKRRELVAALLEQVNLDRDKKKRLGSFSGGMKQRFGIAQALIGDPKLIIVDEPTAGLDPAERNRFYNLLSRIGEKTIVILSTHIVEDVSTLCSRFAIICEGEVMYEDDPDNAVAGLEQKVYSKSIRRELLEQYSWEKITIYDNKIIAASAIPINHGGSYKVHLLVRAGKLYTNDAGTDVPAKQMNDYIDIGIFGATGRDSAGRSQSNPLYIKKYKLTSGEHAFDIIVNGKPISAGIDPYEILIDTNPDDNTTNVVMP